MYKKIFQTLVLIFAIQASTNSVNRTPIESLSPAGALKRVEDFAKNSITSTADRAQYVKELYYSVNGYPADYDTSMSPAPHLDLFNSVLGESGVGGILYSGGYTTCDSIPTSGSLDGSSPIAGTLNLSFMSPTKTIPSYYQTLAGETMDKRIEIAGTVALEIELKCHDDVALQTGYVKFTYADFNIVYEGYFQQNTTTNAVNLDMYVKTQTGGGTDLLIPTQFSTTDGESFTIFSGYIFLGNSGLSDYLVAVTGQTNGSAQIAYLSTTDNSGSGTTTSPDNFGSISSSGGTDVAVECIDISTETVTTGCSNIPAPGALTIGGASNTWTVSVLRSLSF